MKKITGKRLLSLALEIISEIVFGIIAFFIGWGILALCGVDILSEEGFDIALLVGAVVFTIVFIIVSIIINNIKKNY